jgi:hypothetical protein
MNLIELSEQERNWLEALTHVSDEGAPISEEEQVRIIEAYIAADEQFKDKVDRYCDLIEAFGARALYRDQQRERSEMLARQDQSVADKLKARLQTVMALRGEKLIETDNRKLKIVGNGGKAPLVVPDEWRANPTAAPEAFHKRKIELDLAAIRAKLEAGETVEGCRIGERGTRLTIS